MSASKPPLKYVMLDLLRRCRRWLLISLRFNQLAGLGAVVIAGLCAWNYDKAEYFSRAGAIMSLAGGNMTFRRYLRSGHTDFSRDTGWDDQPAFGYIAPMIAKDIAQRIDVEAFGNGITYIVFGTVIWAYGDMWFRGLGWCSQ